MSQPIRGQGGYLIFLISPKNASLVEDVEIFAFQFHNGKLQWRIQRGVRRGCLPAAPVFFFIFFLE